MIDSTPSIKPLTAVTDEQQRQTARDIMMAVAPAIVPMPVVPPMTGRGHRFTTSPDPILGTNKITWTHFVRSVWVLSNTNLHVKDFEAEFGADLYRMFHPVAVRK